MNPRNGNYGRGFGDYFAYRELLEEWLDDGNCEGLELAVSASVSATDDRQRVVVVTGGGGGIGAAIAEAARPRRRVRRHRRPAGVPRRLRAAPRRRRRPPPVASSRPAEPPGRRRSRSPTPTGSRSLFAASWPTSSAGLDAVVNVAGITRPTSFANGQRRRLARRARGAPRRLPQRPRRRPARSWRRPGAAASSASPPDRAGGRPTPAPTAAPSAPSPRSPGSSVGTRRQASSSTRCRRSPSTRMVTAALGRAGAGRRRERGGPAVRRRPAGCRWGRCPTPEELGPFGAHLVGRRLRRGASGQVLFAGGSEVAVIERAPAARGRAHRATCRRWRHVLEAVDRRRPRAGRGEPGEQRRQQPPVRPQPSTTSAAELPPAGVASCAVVTDRPDAEGRPSARRSTHGCDVHGDRPRTSHWLRRRGRALAHPPRPRSIRSTPSSSPWPGTRLGAACGRRLGARCSAEHAGHRRADPRRRRAGPGRPPTSPQRPSCSDPLGHAHRRHHDRRPQPGPGRRRSSPAPRAGATGDRVAAFAVERRDATAAGRRRSLGELVAHLVCSPDAPRAVRRRAGRSATGWFGLRSHPRPIGSITLGGPDIPAGSTARSGASSVTSRGGGPTRRDDDR